MREIDGLPVYRITIDKEYSDGEDLGIDMIAFTKKPAIKTKGMAFTSNQKVQFFSDDVKMRIAAPAMIPMDIYRYDDESGEEYFVEFTETEIEKLYSKFMSTPRKDAFNLEHDPTKKVPAYVLESLLVDSDAKIKMVKDEYGVDVPKGSVFIVSQITDRDYYNELVKNEQVGYSIEGMLGLKLSELNKKNKMENPKFELNGKFYELVDGVPVEVAMATEETEPVAEELNEVVESAEEVELENVPEKEEEEMAEEMPEEKEEEVAAEVNPEMDAEAVMAIVAPALDALRAEILEAIGEANAEEEIEEEEVEMQETKLSVTQRFGLIAKHLSNK